MALTRKELLEKYKILKAEMQKRGLKFASNMPLDKALFKKAMVGIDVASLLDVVVIKDYVSISGSFVKSSREAKVVDVVIKDNEENRDEALQEQIRKAVEGETGKKCRFTYNESGPTSPYIPLFDKIIKAKNETRKVEISKPYPNEHSCRLNNPDKYNKFRRQDCGQKHDGKCIDVIYGIKAGKSEIQALRYKIDIWDKTAASNHCKTREGTFEPASGKIKKEEKVEGNQAFNFEFKKIDKKEHIVGGIIYEPDEEDTQGDEANAKEIWKALKGFMLKKKSIKVMHKGKVKSIPIIECFQAEEDTYKGGTGPEHLIKKGAWWLSIYLGNEPEIWKDILAGKLNGFSMAGRALAST